MPRSETLTRYICASCGQGFGKWNGQCAGCMQWNTLAEQAVVTTRSRRGKNPATAPQSLAQVGAQASTRHLTGLGELDRVLGGGIVPGSVILLGGEPGIGKSTLALQTLAGLSQDQPTLYASGEESLEQLALRSRRLGLEDSQIQALSTNRLGAVLDAAVSGATRFLVVDSIQTLASDELESAPGSVGQIRECADRLIEFAKTRGSAVLLIGHVTKEGALAGPKVLEHLVDTVLYFEGDTASRYRLVRAFKNRFGAVNEIGVFAMTQAGLKPVNNPSAMFLSRGEIDAPGSAVLVSQEGTRPLLVEVQALVDPSTLGNPRRLCVGFDANRLGMLLAILHRHAGLSLFDQDIFVNVAGGVRITETAADLAISAAVISSLIDKVLGRQTAFFGELGLSGEVRPVTRGEDRLREAAKLGFSRAFIPQGNRIKESPEGLNVIKINSAAQLFEQLNES